LNNPDAEANNGFGPIPQGNWRIVKELDETTRKEHHWPDTAFKLEPDPDTAKRVEAMKRDPGSFYVHAKARDLRDQGNGDSRGCIALDKPQRNALKQHIGRWIRVEK
jgi:L,D-transpeptidase catalytic domain.